jgi:aminopeptidase
VDSRYVQLAEIMAGFSTEVRPGDHVLLQTDVSTPHDMNRAVIEAVRKRGGVMLAPMIWDQRLQAAARVGCTEQSLAVDAQAYLATIRGTKVRIALRGYVNPLELSSVPGPDQQRYDRYYYAKVIEEAIENTRWVVTVWPTPGFAFMAGLSTTEAEEMFFRAVLADYPAMQRAVRPLEQRMNAANQVEIKGPGRTHLKFSIQGIGGVPCVGHRNIPDGEVYTAPVRDSMNGLIEYNTLAITKSGERFEDVWFRVRDGKIVESGCQVGDPSRIEQMLDTDEGARYFGEWSLGLNWGIQRIIGDTLFDEKVGGTFHLTPGKAYSNADNGNKSGVHWDIVCDQREAAGGGEIYFDGQLVRKNGIFVPDDLAGLNPAGAQPETVAVHD